ncbi:uncharacterized protein LY89DRAFT_610080 [Mollisia scopiformis]|uniref:DUF2306 domain-containing protein n=1 Tax=Mollisia scopiformis TaxID=149040 RepID=A0A194XMK7_MOLSC|nr:uncharacterized protein LY89DRAFT_610080 [Mollisia scopiformis]KUJ21490.1 hypothetical protein LY89DRAFT_610080 [Mollisia scopiformis]
MRKVYRPLGFSKGYNFPLFVIFAGAIFGFVLARISYLNVTGTSARSFRKSAAPGEWYFFHQGHYRVGIILHLAGCLPAGFLAVWQFVPVIRHKALLFHRINGYVVILLSLIANAGALMIARRAFGGGLDVQSVVGVLAILTTTSLALAYYNIKRLQIDQHRAWMLRAWFYFGTIITTRLFMLASAAIITRSGNYYQVQTCGEVAFNFGGAWTNPRTLPPPTLKMYPQCVNGTNDTPIVVNANMNGLPEQIGAGLGLSFGMALWLALIVHALGVEWYLWLTPAESARLRNVSYERQLEAGFRNPGNAGLTVDRWGDAPAFQPTKTVSLKPMEEK